MKKRAGKTEKTKRQEGFTLMEVIVAISILTVGLLAVASMQISAIQGNSLAGRLTKGTSIAQDKIEELLLLPYTFTFTHPDLIDNETNGGPHVEPNHPSGYTIRWDVTDNNPFGNTKSITVTVTWQDKGVHKTTSLSSYKARS